MLIVQAGGRQHLCSACRSGHLRVLQPDGALSEFTPVSGGGASGQGSWLYTTAAGDHCCMKCSGHHTPSGCLLLPASTSPCRQAMLLRCQFLCRQAAL